MAWRGISTLDRQARCGLWQPAAAPMLRRAATHCVGIIGYGHIGKRTAYKLSQGFGCRVLVHSPSLMATHADLTPLSERIFTASIATLQREDSIITLHVAFSSDASLLELRQRVSAEVLRVLRGESPLHPCNLV